MSEPIEQPPADQPPNAPLDPPSPKASSKRSRKRRGRGEGSIHLRTDGLWEGKISLGYDGDGKRNRRTVYAQTKSGLQKKIREIQSDFALGQLADKSNLTVEGWLQNWLIIVKAKTSVTTYDRYEQLTRLHLVPHLGMVKLQALTPIHVNAFFAKLERAGESIWTRKMTGAVLHNAMRQAMRMRYIMTNPCADVPRPKPGEKEMAILIEEQVKVFLATAERRRLFALFALALGSGMRQGELFGLQWPDIDFDKGTLTIRRSLAQIKGEFILKEPKSKASKRTIRLPPFAIDALLNHRRLMLTEGQDVKTGTVFVTKTGQYLLRSNMIRQVFKPILRAADLPMIRFHDLRHTHASVLLAHGESIKAVSRRLGHSDVALTLRVYAHLLPDADSSLAETVQKAFAV
jgi:integrase